MKKIYRNPEKGTIAGVCQGLAYYADTDPNIIRAIFVMIGLLIPPVSVVGYLVMWIMFPKFKQAKRTTRK